MSTSDSPQVSRGLLVALGVVAGLGAVILLVLYVILPVLGGEESAVDPVTTIPSPEPGASPAPTDDPAEGNGLAEAPVPETFEVFTARDPFQQLVVPASSGSGGGGGSSPSPSPAPTGTAAPPGASVGGTTVRLVDVFTDGDTQKILVTVNGTGYEVAEGETFAQRFRVLDIADQCATLLFGDSRFTLCKGEEIRK